jgi:sulfide:quinone oxidoreductase
MKPTILVLGGGIGGVTVANKLRKSFGNEDGIDLARIRVFEKEKSNLYSPSLTWMMVGKRKEDQISHNLNEIEFGGIEFVYGEIEAIDPLSRTVISGGSSYSGDYIVISLGAEKTDPHSLSSFGHNFYTSKGANEFYHDLKNFKGGTIAITVSSLPHTSPVAPYETAFLIDEFTREKGIRNVTEIVLLTPEEKPMPFAGDKISDAVLDQLKEKNIQYRPNHDLTKADADSLTFSVSDNESVKQTFDLLAFTPNHSCPSLLKDAGLTDSTGWVDVDDQTLESSFKNVFAIGDVASLNVNKDNIPRAGVFAQMQAKVVAHNIERRHAGKTENAVFEPDGAYILDQGTKASKVRGNFESDELNLSKSGVIRHFEKVLNEKTWFLKNFQA